MGAFASCLSDDDGVSTYADEYERRVNRIGTPERDAFNKGLELEGGLGACPKDMEYSFSYAGKEYTLKHDTGNQVSIKLTTEPSTDSPLIISVLPPLIKLAKTEKSGIGSVKFTPVPRTDGIVLNAFYLQNDQVIEILSKKKFTGGARSTVLYKSHHYKLRAEGRSKYITSKGVRISLADVRAWQKRSAVKK